MKFTSAFVVLAAFATAAFATTPATVEADIAAISSQVTTLDNAITAFPATGGSLVNALAIHTDAVNLGTAIDKGTTDVKALSPSPVAESDGQTILAAVQAFEPTIIDALQKIVAKKAAFAALPVGGIPALVKQDLANLNASTSAFEAALIASAPADLKASATSLQSAINSAFATAIAAYA